MHKNLSDIACLLSGSLFSSLKVGGILSGMLILGHHPAVAQVTPDNTLGNESSVVNNRDATSQSVDGGAIRGQNLFHSFQEFNIDAERGVYFANPEAVTNIFSRITGNDVSNILGTLGVDGAANLFLINPNGIIFGDGASLDVQGSFTATSADGIEFGEQGFFSASNPEVPNSLTINPSAYLFNQVESGAIADGSQASTDFNPSAFFGDNFLGLSVPDGESLSFIGDNVSVDGGGAIASEGGIKLGGLTEEGRIDIESNGNNISLNFSEGVLRGEISLNNQTIVSVTTDGGGGVAVNTTGAASSGTLVSGVSFVPNNLTDSPNNSINTDEMVANSCVSSLSKIQKGKFIITGKGGLPVRPGNGNISDFATGEVRNVSSNIGTNSWERGEPIVEPQGFYRLANGKLVMSRHCRS